MINRILLMSVLALVLSLCACSDDDPVAPPLDPGEDGVIHVPGEVATLAEAVAAAADGDSIAIAAGTFDGDVTIDKAITIRGTSQTDDWTILDTSGGPLSLVADSRDIVVRGLKTTGGETGIAIELNQGHVDLSLCEVIAATHGVTIDADTGTVDLESMIFRDCGEETGNGSGLRIWGHVGVDLTNGIFLNIDGGSGVAITASDESSVDVNSSSFQNHDAGNAAVAACTGEALMTFENCLFRGGIGTMIHGSGFGLGLSDVGFDDCAGTMIRLESDHPQALFDSLMTRGTEGTVMSIGDGQETQILMSSFVDHEGMVFDLGDGVTLDLQNLTVAGLTGPLVMTGADCTIDVDRCIVVDSVTPVIPFGTPTITQCDLWRVDGEDAWTGLEEFLGVDGNIEADPLFCDRGDGDYRVMIGSPCSLGMGDFMGAYLVGCE